MATAAAAAKTESDTPAVKAAAPVVPAKTEPISTRTQTLRAAQVRKVPIGRMKPVGHFAEPQQVLLPADWDFEDVLKPEFWSFVAPSMQANTAASVMQDRLGTILHIHTEDHAFYAEVYVHGLRRNAQGQANALDVTCIGPLYDATADQCFPVEVKTGKRWMGRKAKSA